jgi:carboxypeptidase Taq
VTAVAATSASLDPLREALGEVADLERAASVLEWDQETCMPTGGLDDRASQIATVSRLAHERFTSGAVARLLEAAEAEAAGLPPDSDEASLVRVTRRELDEATRVPAELVAEMARATALARPLWQRARALSDWSLFAPAMERTVDLSRRLADALGYEDRPYDALIAATEPGLTTARVESLFAELRAAVVPLLAELSPLAARVDASVLDLPWDEDRQLAFALETIARLGFDLERGRQDLSAHPFCITFGPGDVRLTTRTGGTLGDSCLYSSIHEAGHGMYDQGVPRSLDRTRLWGGASPGVHESQSRLWENLVGRGLPFAEWLVPRLRAAFPDTLAGVEAEAFWRAVNRVQPSYVRVEADEVSYDLHIMLRFEVENELLEGRLRSRDVPEAWSARVRDYLGLEPPSDRDGPLQDIHWTDRLGSFIGYTLGNLISVQLLEAVRRDLPDLDAAIAAGEFAPLLAWLRDRVHRHGRKFTPDELVERATGQPITAGPWIAYARDKFAGLYGR